MARPTKEQQRIISERNRLMLIALDSGFAQVEVAEMFRVPRNTVYNVVKHNNHDRETKKVD